MTGYGIIKSLFLSKSLMMPPFGVKGLNTRAYWKLLLDLPQVDF